MGQKINVPIPINADDEEQNTSDHDSAPVVRRIPGGRGGTLTPFTSETARAAVQARVARKNEVVRAAAQAAVLRGDLRSEHGGDAWIAEVTQAQMQLATTPDAGKASSIAADWLMRHAGIDEPKAGTAPEAVSMVGDVLRMLAGFAASIPAEVVDAVVLDAE